MKKDLLILLFFSFSIFTDGQTNKKVKEIFYNLPLDATRKEISVKLISDGRFRSTDKFSDSTLFFFEPSYIGLCSDLGLVKSKPDSLEVELTWGYSYGPESKKQSDNLSDLYFKSRYFYSSPDSAEKEYQNMLAIFRKITRDTTLVGIDTIFSESPIQSQFKAHGVEFIFHKPYYKVQVLYAKITKDYFGLFLEYTRKERY